MSSWEMLKKYLYSYDENISFVRSQQLGTPSIWQDIHYQWEDNQKTGYPKLWQQNAQQEQAYLLSSEKLTTPVKKLILHSQRLREQQRNIRALSIEIIHTVSKIKQCLEQGDIIHQSFEEENINFQGEYQRLSEELNDIRDRLEQFFSEPDSTL